MDVCLKLELACWLNFSFLITGGSSDQESTAAQKSKSSSGNTLPEKLPKFGFDAGIFGTLFCDVDLALTGAELNVASSASAAQSKSASSSSGKKSSLSSSSQGEATFLFKLLADFANYKIN